MSAQSRRARQSLSTLATHVPALLWTTDLEFNVTSFGGALSQSLKPKRSKGCTVVNFFHVSANSKVVDAHFLASSGESCTFEVSLTRRDLHAHVKPLHDRSGKVVGVIGVAVDYTEYLVAQRALKISEQSYRSLIEEAPQAICRCTATGSFLQVNRAMGEMLGYSESDLLMHNLQTEIFADPQLYTGFLSKLRGKKSCHGFETQWVRQNGEVVTVSLSGREVCDAGGRTSYLDFFAENIGERKQLEEQFRQAQKMQAVGQLAGGIAHDFNNLLTVILGQTELIGSIMLESDAARARLKEIQQAAERATGLTSQLLAFSRRQVLQTKVLDLNTVVGNMNQMLARLIGGSIELSFIAQPGLWPVKVDPGQIAQVLMNLVVNARDAMPEGGRLTIETRNLNQERVGTNGSAVGPADFVLLKVRDTGHGMDENTKARIFEPFFTTKDAGKGTGLGLAVVYGIVKQSGGQVQVESKPKVGTVFNIYLPRAAGAADEASEPPRAEVPSGNETILLVDDDKSIRGMIGDFLKNRGYRVLIARDGADAIRIAEGGSRFDLLLSDLTMPNLGGGELARRLRESNPDLKVVLMSGNPEAHETAVRFPYFLQKPFSMQELAQALRTVLDEDHAAATATYA